MNENTKAEIIKLREKSKFAYVGSVDQDGYPQVKCMFTISRGASTCKDCDVRTHYFSTNTSSKRVRQFRENPKASVYYCSEMFFKGTLFTGTMEVLTDDETKARFWNKGDEKYYPKGVTDPDYCILKFTADTVNYYHGLQNKTLSIEEL